MATTDIGTIISWPGNINWIPSNIVLDGTSLIRAFTFSVPKTGNIDRIILSFGTLTTSETIRVGIETLDSSGNPSGSQYGGSAVATGTPGNSTSVEYTLATPASATAGDSVAVVVQWDSTQGNIILHSFGAPPSLFGSGYTNTYTTSWTKGATSRGGAAIRYDDGLYYETELAGGFLNPSTTFSNASTPDERGNYIIVPETISVCGMYCNADFDGAGQMILYDSNNTALKTWSIPSGVRGNNTTHIHWARFDPIELTKNDIVRVVLKPTSATTIVFRPINCLSNAHLRALPGGVNMYATSRTDGGSWSEDNTSRQPIGLLINGFGGGLTGSPFRSGVFG